MNVAHDVNSIEEARRKEAARTLVRKTIRALYGLRLRRALIESGDLGIWVEAHSLAENVIASATPLELKLLVACAREVAQFAGGHDGIAKPRREMTLNLLSSLDTLGMELERLKNDRDLR
jgi:hypothetical protein